MNSEPDFDWPPWLGDAIKVALRTAGAVVIAVSVVLVMILAASAVMNAISPGRDTIVTGVPLGMFAAGVLGLLLCAKARPVSADNVGQTVALST